MSNSNVNINSFNKIYTSFYIHGEKEDIASAYLGAIDNTPRYKDSTFDYRVYLTRSLGESTTLDNSLFSLEFLYKNKINAILTDRFKLSFLYNTNRSIKNIYTDLEAVKSNNSIGIFDLSTCFYTTRYTKRLPLTSTFNKSLIIDYINNYCNSDNNISEIIDTETLYSDIQNNWDNLYYNIYHHPAIENEIPYGKLVYNIQNSDGTHIMTFYKKNGLYNSYYVDFTKSCNKFDIISVNNSYNVKFVDVRHGIKDDSKCYALISIDNDETQLYYSLDHKYWIQFDELNDNNEIKDKFFDIFNNNYAYKLTDKWNYLNVTNKNISVLNYWEKTINDTKVYLAQIVEVINDRVSSKFATNKTTLMYSYDNINWSPCSFIDNLLLDSTVLNLAFTDGVKLLEHNGYFYLYNTTYDIYVNESNTTSKDSLLISKDLINWDTAYNSKYIVKDLKVIDDNIFAITDYRTYTEEKCNYAEIDDIHQPTIKVNSHNWKIVDINNTSKSYYIDVDKDYEIYDIFKLNDDIIAVTKDASTNKIIPSVKQLYKIYKLDNESYDFEYKFTTNSYILSQNKLIFSDFGSDITYDKLYYITDIDYEKKNEIELSLAQNTFLTETIRIKDIQVIYGNESDKVFIYFEAISDKVTNYIVYIIENIKDSINHKLIHIYESPVTIFKKTDDNKMLISDGNTNNLYLYYYNSEENAIKYNDYSNFVFGSQEISDIENISFITNFDTYSGDLRYNFGLALDRIVIFDNVKRTIYFKSFLLYRAISNNYLFVTNYCIDLNNKDIIEDKGLYNIFIANSKLFALGSSYVYYANTEKMTIKSTKHVNKNYYLYETTPNNPKDITKFCIIWNDEKRKYCNVDVFITYMSEYPDESLTYENDEPESKVSKVYRLEDGELKSEDIVYSDNDFIIGYSNKYDDNHQVSSIYKTNTYTTKEFVEDKDLTSFESDITYYLKDDNGNLVKVTTNEPETETIKVPIDVNKIKVEINPATETIPDSSKTYYKLVTYEPESLTEFDFTQEYYTKVDDKFELYDTATNPTPDSNTTYYIFELFEGDSFATDGSVYYTFDSSTYTETEYKDKTITKTYYHYIDKSNEYDDIYISKDNINFYRLENYLTICRNKYDTMPKRENIVAFKDQVIIILNNDIYSVNFTETGAYLENIMGYFNNGRLLQNNDQYITPYKISNIYQSSIDNRLLIGYTNTYNNRDVVILSFDDFSFNSGWRVSEKIVKIDNDDTDNTYTYILDSHYLGLFSIDGSADYNKKAYIELITYPKEVEEFVSTIKEKYLPYYNFNKKLNSYYLSLIHDYEKYYKELDREFISFYDLTTKFGITSDKYNASKIVKLYNFIVKMQKFVAFVVSAREIIETSIDNYNKIINTYKNYKNYFYDINVIPHMYNILYSIIDTRLSKLSSIDQNTEVYNYFSKELINNNVSDIFKKRVFNKYELIDPLNESARSGNIDDSNNNLDKVYSILTQNYDRMMLVLNNYNPTNDEDLDRDNNYKANKEFIKYLYMAEVTLQIFEVISSVSSQNKSFDTISFDTVMKVLNIDYSKNYSDEEVYKDVTSELNNIITK